MAILIIIFGHSDNWSEYGRWMQDTVGRAWVRCTMFWKSCWVWARSKQMLPTLYDSLAESSYCCIQLAPSREDGTASLCNYHNFVFQLIICLLYQLQLHTHAWRHCSSGMTNICMHQDVVNVSYVCYIAHANNVRSSIGVIHHGNYSKHHNAMDPTHSINGWTVLVCGSETNVYRSEGRWNTSVSLPLFLMQGLMPPYYNNYDDDTDGDDGDTAKCCNSTSNNSSTAAFRRRTFRRRCSTFRRRCSTFRRRCSAFRRRYSAFRRCHEHYGEIEFTLNNIQCHHILSTLLTYTSVQALEYLAVCQHETQWSWALLEVTKIAWDLTIALKYRNPTKTTQTVYHYNRRQTVRNLQLQNCIYDGWKTIHSSSVKDRTNYAHKHAAVQKQHCSEHARIGKTYVVSVATPNSEKSRRFCI